MKQSSTTRYLASKVIPGGNSSPVSAVYSRDKVRVVVHKDGSTTQMSKTKLTRVLHQTLSREQKEAMLKTMRESKDGKTRVTIGGKIKGQRKTYASKAGAKKAVNRYYDSH